MNQCLESPDLLSKATNGITVEEKHLIYLELMIMEQVEDWEIGVGKTEQESGKYFKNSIVLLKHFECVLITDIIYPNIQNHNFSTF